jgi:hypothetical protein
MMDLQNLTDDQLDRIVDYALKLYRYSAEESLSVNDPNGYDRLRKLTSAGSEIECEVDTAMVELDPEDVGEGDAACVSLYVTERATGDRVHLADVYLTEEGMLDNLGTVVWFPDADKWFEA